jgi:hypothetical protein
VLISVVVISHYSRELGMSAQDRIRKGGRLQIWAQNEYVMELIQEFLCELSQNDWDKCQPPSVTIAKLFAEKKCDVDSN